MQRKELKYILRSPLLYISVVLMIAAWLMGTKYLFDNIHTMNTVFAHPETSDTVRNAIQQTRNNINGYAFFKEGFHEFFLPFAAVLTAGLLFSGVYNEEKASGFGHACIARLGYPRYFWSRVWYVVRNTFLYTFLTTLLILAGALLIFSPQIPTLFLGTETEFPLMSLYLTRPYWYSLILSVNLSLFASVFALYGLGASTWIPNRFVAALIPTGLFIVGILAPQFLRIDLLRWIYPENISAFWGSGGLISDLFSVPVRLIIVWLVFLVPAAVLLWLLYRKDRRGYLR